MFNLNLSRGRRVVRWLSKNSNRWENASISLRPFFREELLGVERKLGALGRLRIISHSNDALRCCHNVFSVASQLKEVTLTHGGHLDDVFKLPWSRIPTLSIKATSLSCSFLQGLSASAGSLEHLELSCQSFKNPQNPPFCIRGFLGLRSLAINNANVF
ncbi:hypothetical protein BDZ89DRAFT_113203 [Hymenopellis radicata]|nr:hypothetical protein BDZ89DRAFT_113203 [Hymenopellis radicata]